MSDWRIVSPAPKSAALALAGAGARVRRGVLAQVRSSESAAVYLGDQPIALAMFARHGWRRAEMALVISPAAVPHMRRLIRLAQLTLSRLAETRLVVVAINPANRAGRRMAMLTGFTRARLRNPYWWIFRGGHDGRIVRRRRRSEEGGGGKPQGAAGGERPPAGGAAAG